MENRKGLNKIKAVACSLVTNCSAKLLGDRVPAINKYELKVFYLPFIQCHPVFLGTIFHLTLDFPEYVPRKNRSLRMKKSRKHYVKEG